MAVTGPLSQGELSTFRQQFGQYNDSQNIAKSQQAQQPHYAKGLGGFVERQLPTIGGVVGGVATSPAELLDAVSGVGGTALNIAGAAGGQALGQKIQNSLTGNKSSTAGAALAGAGGEVGGRAVGGLFGKVGSKFAAPVDSAVTKVAEKKAAGAALDEAAPFANVANGQDVKGSIDLMKNVDMAPTPEGMKTAADLTTGQHGEFNNTLRQILGGNGSSGAKETTNYVPLTKDLKEKIIDSYSPKEVATPSTVTKSAASTSGKNAYDSGTQVKFRQYKPSKVNPSGKVITTKVVSPKPESILQKLTSSTPSFADKVNAASSSKDIENLKNYLPKQLQDELFSKTALSGPIKVNVGDYLNTAKEAINEEPLLGAADAKDGTGSKLLGSITKNKENNLFGGKGSLSQTADANKVLDSIQYHQGQAAKFAKAAPGTEGEAIGNVHKQAAKYLEDQLTKSAGADKAVAAHKLDPGDAADIAKNVTDKGGSPSLAQHIIQTINDSSSVKDLRSAQAPFVKASQLADKAANYAKGSGFVKGLAQDASSKGGSNGFRDLSTAYEAGSLAHGNVFAGIPLAAKASRSEPLIKAANNLTNRPARALNNAPSSILSKLTGKTVNAPTTGQIVSKVGGQEVGQAINNPPGQPVQQPAATPYQIQAAQDTAAQQAAASGSSATNADANDPFSSDNIKQAILQDMQTNGGKNISSLVSLYNTFGKPEETQSTTEKNSVDNLNGALATLDTYSQQLDASGGGRGKVGGAVENLLGKFGQGGSTAAQVRAIESQKTDVATAIAKALTNGKPASSQIKSWEDALPNVTDSSAVANQKLQNITASINAKLQTLGAATQ